MMKLNDLEVREVTHLKTILLPTLDRGPCFFSLLFRVIYLMFGQKADPYRFTHTCTVCHASGTIISKPPPAQFLEFIDIWRQDRE